MRRLFLASLAIISIGVGAGFGANYAVTVGSGTTFGSVVVAGVNYAQQFICDLTTPAQCAAVSAGGAVKVDASATTQPVSAASLPLPSGAATSANQSTEITSLATIATNTGAAIPAGTALIGKVGIDQTTPGTTNGVQVNAALPAGTNLLGKTGIDQTTPGTTNGVQLTGSGQVAVSVAPVTATNTATVVDLRPDSPGIITLGPATVANSVPQTISSQYPTNATTTTPTAVTATATGTTAATAATLAATASVTNYVCGFTITADATALATGTAVLSGTISGSLSYLQTILAATNGTSTLTQNFNPCIPASAANTAIVITSAAAGTGGNTIVNIQGYRL